MAAKLNKKGFDYAKELVAQGKVVSDDRDAWSEHQPSTQEENEFIQRRGFEEYSKWHLGVDDEQPVNTKRRYKFPYGDFKKAHRCGIITAEARAGQYKYFDIERAAARLHEMTDGIKHDRLRAA
jgi:hypothetical protein